jgi:chloramphenicol-sensitive protein RarD
MATAELSEACQSETPTLSAADDHARSRQGVIYGVLSYGLWGLIPLYFKAVASVPPVEVLAQRVFWSFVFLAIVLTLVRRWEALGRALRNRQVLIALGTSTVLLAINWFTYIYAVAANNVVEASLGYFLNPLVNVVIGVVLLKEKLRAWQFASVALAIVGVAILGAPPIAITLAVTFAFYGLLRKTVAADGLVGLFVETMLLLPVAAAYLAYLAVVGRSSFDAADPRMCLLLAASGVVTAIPLLLFAAAARRLRFATLGFLQYLAPTIQFLLAVFAFGEDMTPVKWTAMSLIWTAAAIYSVDSLRLYRQQRGEMTRRAG